MPRRKEIFESSRMGNKTDWRKFSPLARKTFWHAMKHPVEIGQFRKTRMKNDWAIKIEIFCKTFSLSFSLFQLSANQSIGKISFFPSSVVTKSRTQSAQPVRDLWWTNACLSVLALELPSASGFQEESILLLFLFLKLKTKRWFAKKLRRNSKVSFNNKMRVKLSVKKELTV